MLPDFMLLTEVCVIVCTCVSLFHEEQPVCSYKIWIKAGEMINKQVLSSHDLNH